MRHVQGLLLLAAGLAVAGFVVVAVGQASTGVDEPDAPGWYAYPPDHTATTDAGTSSAYSSTLQITIDDERRIDTTTVAGVGLVGLSFLLTAGTIGTWAVRTRRAAP